MNIIDAIVDGIKKTKGLKIYVRESYPNGVYNYFFPNILTACGNNQFSWASTGSLGTFGETVTLYDGCYDIRDINEYLQQSLLDAGLERNMINISVYAPTMCTEIKIKPHEGQTTSITFSETGHPSLAQLLGFDPGTYSENTYSQHMTQLVQHHELMREALKLPFQAPQTPK